MVEFIHCWSIATNFALGPDVSFRGKAEVGERQSSLPRSIMTRSGPPGRLARVLHGRRPRTSITFRPAPHYSAPRVRTERIRARTMRVFQPNRWRRRGNNWQRCSDRLVRHKPGYRRRKNRRSSEESVSKPGCVILPVAAPPWFPRPGARPRRGRHARIGPAEFDDHEVV